MKVRDKGRRAAPFIEGSLQPVNKPRRPGAGTLHPDKAQCFRTNFDNRLAKDLGVKVKYVSAAPASRVESLVTDKVDVILANLTVTKERAEKADSALPYLKVALGVVSPENAHVKDVKELKGKTLIIAKGTTAKTYFEKNHPEVKSSRSTTSTPTPTTRPLTAAATPS